MHMFVRWMRLFLMANNQNNNNKQKNPKQLTVIYPYRVGLKTSMLPHGDWFTDLPRPAWILVIISTGARSSLSFSDTVLQLSWWSCLSHYSLRDRIRVSVRRSAKQIPDCWVQKCSRCWCLVYVPQDMGQAGWGHGMSWDSCGRERKSNTSASVHLITSAASPWCSPAQPLPCLIRNLQPEQPPLWWGSTTLFCLWKALSRPKLEAAVLKSRQDSNGYLAVLLIPFI